MHPGIKQQTMRIRGLISEEEISALVAVGLPIWDLINTIAN